MSLRQSAVLFLILYVVLFSYGAQSAELIVNPGVKQTHMSADSVRALYTMRLRRWPDGMPARVFVLPDRSPVHRNFSKKILGVFPHQLRRSWDRMTFSGLGQAPTEVRDEAEMRKRVSETPGAVGYVSDRTDGQGITFVSVD